MRWIGNGVGRDWIAWFRAPMFIKKHALLHPIFRRELFRLSGCITQPFPYQIVVEKTAIVTELVSMVADALTAFENRLSGITLAQLKYLGFDARKDHGGHLEFLRIKDSHQSWQIVFHVHAGVFFFQNFFR